MTCWRRWSTKAASRCISDDGKTFTFDSPEAVAWLQMYVDMVKAGTVDKTVLVTDQDRVGLDLFTSGKAAFYQTGPNLIREVRANNPGLYGYLAVVPAPVGKSGVLGKGLMGISVKNDTKFPNASIALAQFFTNPQEHAGVLQDRGHLPLDADSYDDPFFAAKPVAIEDSAKPIAKDIIAKYADIVPTIPKKADVNEIVLAGRFSRRCSTMLPPQKALSDAVAKANALMPSKPALPDLPALSLQPAERAGPGGDLIMTKKISLTPYLFLTPALVDHRRLCAVSDCRGGLLQLYRLQHRDAAGVDRSEELSSNWSGPDLLAGAAAFVHLPDRDADPDLPFDHAGHRRQSQTARHQCLSRAVLYSCHQRQHRRRHFAWRLMLDTNGLLNSMLIAVGILQEPMQWLAEPAYTLPIAMLLTIWLGLGYYMMIFLAGLQNIPEELYDAALIDGCNHVQKHWYVSLPGLRPQIVFVAVISSLAALEVFNEIFILTGGLGGILNSGVTMVFYLWRQAFRLQHAGYASAIAMVLLVITLAFSIMNIRRLEGDGGRLVAMPTQRPDASEHGTAADASRRFFGMSC